MDEILKMIGGIVLVTATVIYFLAWIFAPFGIVWLILNH
jgi:F0F1-type ATP synthase assembly protein I